MTTTREPDTDLASPSASAAAVTTLHGADFVTTALTTARRTVLQFFRTPQLLVQGTIQGPLFLLMFRYVFGGAISTRGAVDYPNVLVPGFLVTVIIWTGMGAAAGVAEDSSTGVYDRLRSLPVPRTAVILGRSLADTALIAWGIVVTGIVGFAVGFRINGTIGEFLVAIGVIMFAGFCCSWVFITMGLVAGNAQAAQGMSMLLIPFSFISSANVPVSSMPGWMQPFAANQPVTVMINSVRALTQGGTERIGLDHTTGYWTVLAIVWSVAILAVFVTLSTRRFARQT